MPELIAGPSVAQTVALPTKPLSTWAEGPLFFRRACISCNSVIQTSTDQHVMSVFVQNGITQSMKNSHDSKSAWGTVTARWDRNCMKQAKESGQHGFDATSCFTSSRLIYEPLSTCSPFSRQVIMKYHYHAIINRRATKILDSKMHKPIVLQLW